MREFTGQYAPIHEKLFSSLSFYQEEHADAGRGKKQDAAGDDDGKETA